MSSSKNNVPAHIVSEQNTKKLRGEYFPKWPNVISTWGEVCVVTPSYTALYMVPGKKKLLYYKMYMKTEEVILQIKQATVNLKIQNQFYMVHFTYT